ncbi:MAG: hypothetical protein ABFD97_02970 [Syntrophobacter sp.]
MKIPKLRPSLLSIALCTLIVILMVKLTIIIGDPLFIHESDSAIQVEPPGNQEVAQEKRNADLEKKGTSFISESHAAAVPSDKSAEKPSRNVQQQQTASTATDALTFIQQRENELRRKEEQLKEKEERLAKIEKEVEQKTKELLALQKEIQAYRSERQDTQNTKVRSLAKIYGTMKPKEAAKLLENLEDKLVMGIISTMSSDEAAAILALMDVKKAAKISEALSGR